MGTIASFFFLMYVVVSIAMFGIPDSLSQTHYLWMSKRKVGKAVFPTFLSTFCVMLLPYLMKATDGSRWQFVAFIMIAALVFVAAAPFFLAEGQKEVHTIAAIISAIAGISFTCIFGHWWVAAICAASGGVLSMFRMNSKVFFLEMGAFCSVLTTVVTM